MALGASSHFLRVPEQIYGKFGEISKYGGGDGREVGLGRVMDLWDKDKFDEWRKRETEGYGEREMGIVTIEAKGRRRGRGRSKGGN